MLAVSIAVANLPTSFVENLEVRFGLNPDQSGWLYRLLAGAAVAQATYGAFFLLVPARVSAETVTSSDPDATMGSFVRTGVVLTALTVVYGVGALALTGHRGGFWLFMTLAAAQLLWHYRALRDIAQVIEQEAIPGVTTRRSPAWTGAGPAYTPPLARGVEPRAGTNGAPGHPSDQE